MSKYHNLSDADSLIMEILWRDKETSSSAIAKELKSELNWTPQTIRLYLKRLMERGFVGANVIRAKLFTYYPIVSKQEYIDDKMGSFYNKYCDNLSSLVAGIIESENIEDSDLDNLEKMIREARKKEGK